VRCIAADSSPARRPIPCLFDDPDLEAQRHCLFRLRHPSYRGQLGQVDYDDSDYSEEMLARVPPRLIRLHESDGRKTDTSTLTSDIVRSAQSLKRRSLALPESRGGKRMRFFEPSRTPPSDADYDSTASDSAGTSTDSVDAKRRGSAHRRMSSSGAAGRPRANLTAQGRQESSCASRGRNRRRGRPPKYPSHSDSRKSRVDTDNAQSSPGSDRGGRFAGRGRFSSKHATCGSFLLRVLKSGSFEEYLS